jgi:4-amino-4-deoxy-L-arabinose transferase-like glycosyltransferase
MSIEASRDATLEPSRAVAADPRRLWILGALGALATLLWVLTFVGYTSSDDGGYLDGARGWLHHFPFVGKIWWHVRLPTVLPIAISIGLLGEGDVSLVLPSLLYEIGIVVLAFAFLDRMAGRVPAIAAALLLLTLPINVMQSSIAGADLPMVFSPCCRCGCSSRPTMTPTRSAHCWRQAHPPARRS